VKGPTQERPSSEPAAGALGSPHDWSSLEPWFILRSIEGLGDLTFLKLIEVWGSPVAVLGASHDELLAKGCSPSLAGAIRRGPDDVALARTDKEINALSRMAAQVLTVLDEGYPARLRTIPDPPPLLYMGGTLTEEDQLAVAIVGARRATAAGRILTEELAKDLGEAGFTVVSGLARGVDAAAHRGALAGPGRTIAVLGCGIDRTYPPEHDRLRREIEERGAVISELPLWSSPQSHHFPKRNRIISGLSLGVVVTEAAINSGSLITARVAAEQGREVFAVPGFVKAETSRGTNALIKDGAALVEGVSDVIDVIERQLEPSLRARVRRPLRAHAIKACFGEQERLVHDALTYDPRTIDELVEATHLSVPHVMAALLSLELKQSVRQVAGQRYVKV